MLFFRFVTVSPT
ncbi:hypothetical protein HPF13_1214, partial [Helicobacter pylori]